MLRFTRKFVNYMLVRSQQALGRERVVGHPYYVVLDPTSYCQLDCPFCGRVNRPLAHLKFADFKRTIDRVGKTCVNLELYNWGEPLLNNDLIEMIRYASREHGIYTRISSNLNLKKDEVYRELVASGLASLTISLDGASQESYEKYRVKGSIDAVYENIELMVAHRRALGQAEPRLAWQFLVFRHNEHEIDEAIRKARQLGVDEIVFRRPNIPADQADWVSGFATEGAVPASSGMQPESRAAAIEPAAAAAAAAASVRTEPRSRVLPKPTMLRRPATADVVSAPAPEKCTWPYVAVAINANGAVAPCCAIAQPEEDFGNLGDAAFEKIWNNEEFQVARRFVTRHEIAPHHANTCARCPIKGTINFSPSIPELIYYTVPALRRLYLKWRGFKVKIDKLAIPADPH